MRRSDLMPTQRVIVGVSTLVVRIVQHMTESTDVFILRARDPAGTETGGVVGHLTSGTLRDTAWIGGCVLGIAAFWGVLVVGVGVIWGVGILLVVASDICA